MFAGEDDRNLQRRSAGLASVAMAALSENHCTRCRRDTDVTRVLSELSSVFITPVTSDLLRGELSAESATIAEHGAKAEMNRTLAAPSVTGRNPAKQRQLQRRQCGGISLSAA